MKIEKIKINSFGKLENKEYIPFEKLNSLINMGMDFFSVRKFETNFKYTKEDNSISGTALTLPT